MINSIQDQIKSKHIKSDTKKYWTEDQLNQAKYNLLTFKFVDLPTHLGRSYKSILPKLFLFLSKLNNRAYNEYRPFPIIQTSARWNSLDRVTSKQLGISDLFSWMEFSWKDAARRNVKVVYTMKELYDVGYQQNTARLVAYAEKLGIIEAVCKSTYKGPTSFMNMKPHSKYYICNKNRLHEILNIIKSVISISIHNNSYNTLHLLNSLHITYHNTNNTYINHLLLPIAHKFVACDSEDKYTAWMDDNNANLPVEERIVFEGKRGWSQVCNMKKGTDRDTYLTKRFNCGIEDIVEWDRSGCIPNLMYTLNTGKYLDNRVDLHEKLNGKKFKTKQEREDFKTLNMMKWFGDARSIRGIIHYAHKHKSITKSQHSILNGLCEITKAYNHGSWDLFEADSLAYYKDARKKAEEFLGDVKKWKDEIFIHETKVHIRFMHNLQLLGYKPVEVYDGFFFKKDDKPSDKLLNKLYKECVLHYAKEIK